MSQATARKRRWLQFSLRSLLLAVLFAGVFFGGRESGLRTLRFERQRTAAARMADLARWRAELSARSSELATSEARPRALELKFERESDELRRLQNDRRRALEAYRRQAVIGNFDPDRPRAAWLSEYWRRWEQRRRCRSV